MGMSVMDRIAAAGRAAVDDAGADTLVLGFMSMAFHDVTGDLQRRIGVPVVNPVAASLAMADLLVRAEPQETRVSGASEDSVLAIGGERVLSW